MSAVYIEVIAQVRYWEDAKVNDFEDDTGTLIPHRKVNDWCPIIHLADGIVLDWPAGVVADVHYKICDAGEYWLLNEQKERIGKWAGYYVPDKFLCHGTKGYGDYIIMKIDGNGIIKDWRAPEIEWGQVAGVEDMRGWLPIVPDSKKRLHDAAPDLLEALIELNDCGVEIPDWKTRDKVAAAIAKATGEEL